jgi:hypothetical protein
MISTQCASFTSAMAALVNANLKGAAFETA